MVAERLDPATALAAAATRTAIIEVVRRLKHEAVADRLDYLIELEVEEPDEEPMDIDSLRAAVRFLLRDPQMPRPGIGVGPDGMIGFDWRLRPKGIVALSFGVADLVEYAAIVPDPSDRDDYQRFSGALQSADVLNLIMPLLSQVDAQ